ncbi:MAG: substrate-binding domain-containing protein [Flavipsychrobacter sp.]|nr:substrate-binding domain-containing protein [Flavipsychrobacter sp.]
MQVFAKMILLAGSLALLASCGGGKSSGPTDTTGSGQIDISVDETYRPVIEQQLKVFDSSYPEAKITPHYKAEADCFKDFFDGKARLILVTRELSEEEVAFMEQKKVVTTSVALVRDAIAVILPPGATDTMFGIEQLKGILTGAYDKKKYTVVFDNERSSTVRYITDSLLAGQKLGGNVFAAQGNDSVLAYVERNKDAIGFVGVNYVGNPDGSTGDNEFIGRVKIASIWNDEKKEAYKPYQAFVANQAYPLSRNMYFIHGESYPGLGTGFGNFLKDTRGQLIFAHAHLFPLKMNIIIRDAAISNE